MKDKKEKFVKVENVKEFPPKMTEKCPVCDRKKFRKSDKHTDTGQDVDCENCFTKFHARID